MSQSKTEECLMATLFEIAADLQNLRDAMASVEEAPKELQDELESVFAGMLSATGAELAEKLDNYARLITYYQDRAALRKAEAEPYGNECARLKALAAADEADAKRLKDRLKVYMETTGVKKLESNFHKFTLAQNGGKLPLIVDDGVTIADIPSEFHRVDVSVDNSAVRAVLESGESLEWARLGERGSSIRIK
jgi:hypothetical protein